MRTDVNKTPERKTGVQLKISGHHGTRPRMLGRYRNLNVQGNAVAGLTNHAIAAPAKNSIILIDQYKFWDNFRDPTNGLYCDSQSPTGKDSCSRRYSAYVSFFTFIKHQILLITAEEFVLWHFCK